RTDLGNFRSWSCPEGPGGGRDLYFTGRREVGMGPHGPVAKGEHNLDRPDRKDTIRHVGAESNLGPDQRKFGDGGCAVQPNMEGKEPNLSPRRGRSPPCSIEPTSGRVNPKVERKRKGEM